MATAIGVQLVVCLVGVRLAEGFEVRAVVVAGVAVDVMHPQTIRLGPALRTPSALAVDDFAPEFLPPRPVAQSCPRPRCLVGLAA
jgi:hypothetical protein